ncbi:MAG TPA: hypothetical protein VIK04_09315 [Solirubrobacteraceae bacterium]
MTEHQSSRTLVKSAPELWAECSDAASLTRHLGTFGEIHITKLEPETAVAWEGAAVSGTVRLEPSGWGTRVTLTMSEAAGEVLVPEPPPAAAALAEPKPELELKVEFEPDPEPEPEPEPDAEPEPETEPLEVAVAVAAAAEVDADAAPDAGEPAASPPRMLGRLLLMFRRRAVVAESDAVVAESDAVVAQPEAVVAAPHPVVEPDPVVVEPDTVVEPPTAAAELPPEAAASPVPPGPGGGEALTAALDSLGRAHHRPYSR